MMPMRMMPGVRFMNCSQKPDASEIANQIINNRDKDGDGALNADELGKLSDRLGVVETDFNEDGLIDREKLVSKISEKLEKMEELPKKRGPRIYRSFNNSGLLPYPRPFNNSGLLPYSRPFNNSGLLPYSRPFNNSGLLPYSALRSKETEPEILNESTIVISEPDNNSEPEMASVVSGNQSISDLVKQLLSRLDISNEETETFMEVMKNYGINVTV